MGMVDDFMDKTVCSGSNERGRDYGYSIGYVAGKDQGYSDGYYSGKQAGHSAGKKEGYQVGRNEGYQVGQKEGYDAGLEIGKNEGYTHGEGVGYQKGYTFGTLSYVKEHGIPSLGLSLVILLAFLLVYYIYRYLKDPSKRLIDKNIDRIEAERQKILVINEMRRKKYSYDEISKFKAKNTANQLLAETTKSITNESLITELERIRSNIEVKLVNIQITELSKILDEYKNSLEEINATRHLSKKEKADLYLDLNAIIQNN